MKKHFAKIFIAFVAIVYVMSTIGVSVFSHYCGGELEHVTLFSKTKSCCGEEESDMGDGCCKDVVTHVSFQKDFTFAQLKSDYKVPFLALAIFNFQHSIFNFNGTDDSFITVNKEYPPPNLVQREIVSCSVIRV